MVLSERDFLLSSSSKGSQSDWCGFTEHSVSYLTLGGYADSTSQMSVTGREFRLKEGLYCNWKIHNICSACEGRTTLQCLHLLSLWRLQQLAATFVRTHLACGCTVSILWTDHCHRQWLAQGGPARLGPKMKARPVRASLSPQLSPPDLPLFHFVVKWLQLRTK